MATSQVRWDTSYEWKAVTLLGLGFGLVGLDRWIIAPLFPFMLDDLGLNLREGHDRCPVASKWKQETLMNVPHYNPHWQITYELAKPLKVRKGSTITAYGHYDNSSRNFHNPAPDSEVRFGPQSTDEMYTPFIEVSIDSQNLCLKRLEEWLR